MSPLPFCTSFFTLAALVVVPLATAPSLPPSPLPAAPAPWNNSGHRTISYLTWRLLSEKTRAEVTRFLAAHPRYQADLLDGLGAESPDDVRQRWAFALASNWPDTVRSLTNPLHHDHDHPTWHYVDMPFVVGDVTPPVPPEGDGNKSPEGPRNVLEALAKNVLDLRDTGKQDGERAIALCWVLHLTEDVHQPLHACTLYSPQFPQGDKGGNSFRVSRASFEGGATNLHSLWDGLLGEYHSPAMGEYVADGLARPEYAREHWAKQLAVTDPAAWAKESHDLAVEMVYLKGTLRGAAAGTDEAKKPPLLPNGYIATAEGVAVQRAVLCSYRLADLLNGIFDAK